MKKISVAIITSVLLVLSAGASADTVSQVWSCKLNEGKTQEDAQAINAAKLMDADENEELNAAFNELQTCTGNRLYQGEETEAAK
jgi:hypothetical protein